VLNVKSEDRLRFASVTRNKIPGMHECLNRNVIPILEVNSMDDIADGTFEVKSIKFMNGSDDPLAY